MKIKVKGFISSHIDAEVMKKLFAYAEKMHMNRSAVVEEALKLYLHKQSTERKSK